ncbi:MAG: inositol monophosphatase [Nanoarchaeota archaeon]|nr:inositol monophosphatase [Nanoarchaeota archaeon]
MNLKEELNLAIEAARKAGEYLRDLKLKDIEVLSNLDNDIKLDVDKKAEGIILNQLKDSIHGILSEESGNVRESKTGLKWVIDPLDGSLNFFKGLPQNVVSIGLFKDLKPIAGVVYDYNQDEMYTGIVGSGAWLNGQNIKVSDISPADKSIMAIGFPSKLEITEEHLLDFVKKIQTYKKIRYFGSAALSLVYVASGKLEAYTQEGIKFWDFAGGLAIAVAAGAKTKIEKLGGDNNFKIEVFNI